MSSDPFKASAEEEERLLFAPEQDELAVVPKEKAEKYIGNWKILIVDDEPEVHEITRLSLRNFSFASKSLSFFNAYSGQQAKKEIEQNPDIAVILLDVVMESDEAGLQFVKYVRQTLKNDLVQIILRTGQPGQVPEMSIVEDYQINDYKSKTELTKPKLLTTIRTALRTFSSLYKLQLEIQHRERVEVELHQLNVELEQRVEQRTAQISKTNQQLQQEIQVRREAEAELQIALQQLQATQVQLIHAEKMSSLGQLVAGIAHEVNNPVNFISGNLQHTWEYASDLLKVIEIYQRAFPQPAEEILEQIEDVDLEFLQEDFPKMIQSMQVGANRIKEIVKSLRSFSRLDEAEVKTVNIHDGIDSTLMILQHRLKAISDRPEIEVIKNYAQLPLVECYPGQLNQVFMNILANAIDALEETSREGSSTQEKANPSTIKIKTEVVEGDRVAIRIADNGKGIEKALCKRLFEPFFTTKSVGKGTGLGLSISYQIVVELHGGRMHCDSVLGEGTEFAIAIPLRQSTPSSLTPISQV